MYIVNKAARQGCIGLLLGMALMANECVAQELPEQPGYAFTVVRPQISRTGLRSPTTGAQIVDITLSQSVALADLDLARIADIEELEKRVEILAHSLCRAIDESYPLLASSSKRNICVRRAVRDALAQVTTGVVD